MASSRAQASSKRRPCGAIITTVASPCGPGSEPSATPSTASSDSKMGSHFITSPMPPP